MSGPMVFISYSHDDVEWVRQFAKALERLDVNVCLDEWQAVAGGAIGEAIEAGLRLSDAIVIILSHSKAQLPDFLFVLGVTLGMGKRLIQIRGRDLETARIPFLPKDELCFTQGTPADTAREVAAALEGGEELRKQRGA